jgi:hypothetical protein
LDDTAPPRSAIGRFCAMLRSSLRPAAPFGDGEPQQVGSHQDAARAAPHNGDRRSASPCGWSEQSRDQTRPIIRDSVEWIVWAVPAGSEGAPVEGRGARQDNRPFLDGPAGVCYCFSELRQSRLAVSCGRDGACDPGETKRAASH